MGGLFFYRPKHCKPIAIHNPRRRRCGRRVDIAPLVCTPINVSS